MNRNAQKYTERYFSSKSRLKLLTISFYLTLVNQFSISFLTPYFSYQTTKSFTSLNGIDYKSTAIDSQIPVFTAGLDKMKDREDKIQLLSHVKKLESDFDFVMIDDDLLYESLALLAHNLCIPLEVIASNLVPTLIPKVTFIYTPYDSKKEKCIPE